MNTDGDDLRVLLLLIKVVGNRSVPLRLEDI